MNTMRISMPDTLKSFVEEQTANRGYESNSEYIRDLICRKQERLRLRDLMLQGASSAPTTEANSDYFDGLRDRINRSAWK